MNAVLRESDEVAMAANETTIEAHIGFLRSDLSDVKQDVRKLTADSTTIQTTLRDKIDQSHAALSAGQAALSDRMDRGFETLNARIDAGDERLGDKIDAVSKDLGDRIVAVDNRLSDVDSRLGQKIDAVDQRLGDKIDAVSKDLGDRIVAVDSRLSAVDNRLGQKIDAVDQRLGEKIDAVDERLGNKIDNLTTAFAELRGFHKTVLWVCGGVVTAVTVALSVGKSFGWF